MQNVVNQEMEAEDILNAQLEDMLPKVSVDEPEEAPIQQQTNEGTSNIISDGELVGAYKEILDNIRDDRKEIDSLLANFVDMVMNDGDGSTSSKEAVVNLIKIKSDTTDKMAKVADLMTRVKLKETNTFPKYLSVHNQTNNIENIESKQIQKKELLRAINVAKKKINKKG